MEDGPLLSVIITVYNTERFLDRCLQSLLEQFYRNIEIIVVNDGSKGNIDELIKKYKCVKYVTHNVNKGLFRARITGLELSKGEYIAFLDADDYVSKDFYRSLVFEAIDGNYDIVSGKTLFEKDCKIFIKPLHESSFLIGNYKNEEVRNKYFAQQGSCFAWHTIWNKIYKRTLWMEIYPFLSNITDHIVLTEDILFSSLLFYNAKSFKYVDNDGYHYCDNIDSSTKQVLNIQRFEKNVKDTCCVFDNVFEYLKMKKASDAIISNFNSFWQYYMRRLRDIQKHNFNDQYYQKSKAILDKYTKQYKEDASRDDYFFERHQLVNNPALINIENIISKKDISTVAFYVDDVLLVADNNRNYIPRASVIRLCQLSIYLNKEVIIINDSNLDDMVIKKYLKSEKIEYKNKIEKRRNTVCFYNKKDTFVGNCIGIYLQSPDEIFNNSCNNLKPGTISFSKEQAHALSTLIFIDPFIPHDHFSIINSVPYNFGLIYLGPLIGNGSIKTAKELEAFIIHLLINNNAKAVSNKTYISNFAANEMIRGVTDYSNYLEPINNETSIGNIHYIRINMNQRDLYIFSTFYYYDEKGSIINLYDSIIKTQDKK